MKKWQLLKSESILSNKWIKVNKNQYEIAEGNVIDDYYVVEKADFVLIVAVDKDEKLILGTQYRPATDKFYISVPAGYLGENEDPEETAKRELLEETGYKAIETKLIGQLDPLPGYIKSKAYIVYCKIEGEPEDIEDKEELQEIAKLSWDEAIEKVRNGEIDEIQTASAILLADKIIHP